MSDNESAAPEFPERAREAVVGHVTEFFGELCEIARRIPVDGVELLCAELAQLCDRGGRLFVVGVGGSSANGSHAVNNFRKLCGIEA